MALIGGTKRTFRLASIDGSRVTVAAAGAKGFFIRFIVARGNHHSKGGDLSLGPSAQLKCSGLSERAISSSIFLRLSQFWLVFLFRLNTLEPLTVSHLGPSRDLEIYDRPIHA